MTSSTRRGGIMNLRTCKTLVGGVAALLFMAAAGCTDTSVEPKSTVSDANIFNFQ
jgi:hypothetical protein